ncbi:dUTP diphosphatase [Ahrensia sp. 13_GOM-1096m]|uniref:dUTP diphosphatase n=1 Tax=Ahrensia sp. 13_GOM-1096m TaxID=1380380 RepID=UPI000479F8C3|nr:dUTP diphosphatase [Ahrensia sp. 13_GOM-1096m]
MLDERRGGLHQDNMMTLPFYRLPHSQDIALPSYETAGAAGMDLRAAVPENEPLVLASGARVLVPTGFIITIPDGYEGQVRPRSGLALKHGITCLNTPGTIDCDYRGELMVLLINHGEDDFTISRNMRIAQLVIAPVTQLKPKESKTLPDATVRGAGGFGSTGV